jgi:hypothetical protein
VRELKAAKAPKDQVTAAVNALLALKTAAGVASTSNNTKKN